jgi:hypothetical protein
MSLDALVEKLLTDALPVYEMNGIHAYSEDDASDTSLARIIARVKAMPPNPDAIERATKSADDLAADLQINPPSGELLTFEEIWPLWQAFEQELKAFEQADAIRDGRI